MILPTLPITLLRIGTVLLFHTWLLPGLVAAAGHTRCVVSNDIPNSEKLKDVCEGYMLLTTEELVSLMSEIAPEGSIQRILASAVTAKRLRVAEEGAGPSNVVPLRRASGRK